MFLKQLNRILLIKRKTSTDRQPTGFLQNNSVAAPMIQPKAVSPDKILDYYDAYDAIVGTASHFSTGLASHISINAAIADVASGSSILILPGTYTESVVVDKKLVIMGKGHTTNIDGTITFTSSAAFSIVKHVRVADDITLNMGADGIFFREFYLANGKTVTDNGNANSVAYVEE